MLRRPNYPNITYIGPNLVLNVEVDHIRLNITYIGPKLVLNLDVDQSRPNTTYIGPNLVLNVTLTILAQ